MDNNASLQVFPTDATPYYIVAHPYSRVSAGIKCLHLLCHNLNLRGYPAYLLPLGELSEFSHEEACEPDFLTPILTRRIARRHYETGRTPITVYPEIVSGNPYAAPCVVRYVLNFPGLLGGDKTFSSEELCFGYSKVLAESVARPENVLFIPASDTRIFHPGDTGAPRSGSCYYASKYKREHKGETFDATRDSVEITARMPNSQSPKEIAELFRRSEIFYTYENTALAIEATLCGCPAVFLPNPHLQSIIASEELGSDGVAWGDSPEEIKRAKDTVGAAIKNFEKAALDFHENLSKFIEKTQAHVQSKPYTSDQYLKLTQKLVVTTALDEIPGELGIKDRRYAPLLRKLPWKVEQAIGSLMCSFGLMSDGEFLWNRAQRRSKGE